MAKLTGTLIPRPFVSGLFQSRAVIVGRPTGRQRIVASTEVIVRHVQAGARGARPVSFAVPQSGISRRASLVRNLAMSAERLDPQCAGLVASTSPHGVPVTPNSSLSTPEPVWSENSKSLSHRRYLESKAGERVEGHNEEDYCRTWRDNWANFCNLDRLDMQSSLIVRKPPDKTQVVVGVSPIAKRIRVIPNSGGWG